MTIKMMTVLIVSLLLSLMLSILPLPSSLVFVMPSWTLLFLFFWTLSCPEHVGLMTAWFSGIAMDLLTGRLMGEYALCFVVIIFFWLRFQRQLKVFPVWQQGFVIGCATLLGQGFQSWLQALSGQPQYWHSNWLAPLTTGLLWFCFAKYFSRLWGRRGAGFVKKTTSLYFLA